MKVDGLALHSELIDPNHPDRRKEWNTFLSYRQELMNDMATKTIVNLPGAVPTIDAAALQSALMRMQMADELASQKPDQMRERDYQQRLGAANIYGIENPEEIPLGQLEQMLAEARIRRGELRDEQGEDIFMKDVAYTVPGVPAFIGFVDSLVRTAETLPFGVGKFLSGVEEVQSLNQWIGSVRELAVGGLNENEQGIARMQETGGNLVGFVAPGYGAWKFAGWALGAARIGGVTATTNMIQGNNIIQSSARSWGLLASNPILHRSIQGGVATVLLESGGDGPIEEKAMNIALGTGLGALAEFGGPIGAAAIGAGVGAMVGSADEKGLEGAMVGATLALGLNRAWRFYSQRSGAVDMNASWWTDAQLPGQPEPPRYISAPTRVRRQQVENATPPSSEIVYHMSGSQERLALPEVSSVTKGFDDYIWRGDRSLFYETDEPATALIARWSNFANESTAAGGPVDRIVLTNRGSLNAGATNVHEVNAHFENLFVLTPESAPLFRRVIGEAQTLDEIQYRMRTRGFDGLAVQGVQDYVNAVGPERAIAELGITPELFRDNVYTIGSNHQVKFVRPIVDGELIEEAFSSFGKDAGVQVTGTLSATFQREAARNLRPFEVGPAKALDRTPQWLSETRGLMYRRQVDSSHPLVPEDVTSLVVQDHEIFGPRVLLLDDQRVTKASFPASSLDEAKSIVQRLGFAPLEPNSVASAEVLAHSLSNADLYVNNSMLDILGQQKKPSTADLIGVAFKDNPGRLAVISDIGNPWAIRSLMPIVKDAYGIDFNPDANMTIVERPTGVFHAIVGPEELITQQKVDQFQKFGMFSGMQVGTVDGITVRVNSIWKKGNSAVASISPMYSEIEARVPASYLLPGRTSVQQPLTGGTYKAFQEFAMAKFNEEAAVAGIPPATSILDSRLMSLIDRYIEDFGQGMSAYEMGRFADSLEWNIASSLRAQSGVDGAVFDDLLQMQADAFTAATDSGELFDPDISTLAVARGMIWEPPYLGESGKLVDQHSNLVIPFETEVAAETFLRNFNREVRDLTTAENAKLSAFSGLDSFALKAQNGIEFPTESIEAEAMFDAAIHGMEAIDNADADLEMISEVMNIMNDGGGTPPPPPPPPSSSGGATPEPPDPRLVATMNKIHAAAERRAAKQAELEAKKVEANIIGEAFRKQPDKLRAAKDFFSGFMDRYTAPTRVMMQKLDEFLRQVGVERPTAWRDITRVLDGKSIANNEAAPWLNELNDILNVFDRAHIRNGTLYNVVSASSIPNETLLKNHGYATAREMNMAHYGFNEEQKLGVVRLREFFDRLHAEATGFTDIGYIYDYLPRLRYFLDLHNENGWNAWSAQLPNELKWSATYAREGNLQAYYKDVRRVGETYVRGLFFEKHVRAPFERANLTWTDAQIPDPIRNYMGELLYTVRHGHTVGYDPIINGLTKTINNIIKVGHSLGINRQASVVESEVLSFIGRAFGFQYMGLLGNSVSTIIRELYQPMLLAPQIGVTNVASAYAKFIKDPGVRNVWSARALKYGWAEPNRPAVVNSEFFTGEMKTIEGTNAFTPEEVAGREAWAQQWDKVYMMLPKRLQNGVEGIPFLDPLWAYKKFATNPGRIIASNAAFEHTVRGIAQWQRGEISYQQMLEVTDVANKPWSVKQEFEEAIRRQDWEGAAKVMGDQGAATQFYFGIAEQAQGIRGAGIAGRAVMQFMNFSNQFLWHIARESKLRSGTQQAKYMARLGALALIPSAVGAAIGWQELNKFNWFLSLGAGGGIAVDPVMNMVYSNTAIRKQLLGQPLSPEEEFALARARQVFGDIPMNPYGSTIRSLNGYMDALTDPNPNEAFFRMTLTGRGYSGAPTRAMESYTENLIQQGNQEFMAGEGQQGLTPAQMEQFSRMLDSLSAAPMGAMD